ncbi:MAG: type I restriction enzyme HsdR N-terminal domain-containing protein, partial [Bacteroidales bacterium]
FKNNILYMLKQRTVKGRLEIYDPIRKKWLLFTEEERVRQIFILYMIGEKKIPESHISVEKEIQVNGLAKRYDIVIFDDQGNPWMVIECKAPQIEITQEVLEQVGRYNKTLRAPIIGVTNGKVHKFFEIDFETEVITALW